MKLSRRTAGLAGLTLVLALATVPQTQVSSAAPRQAPQAEKSQRSGLGNGLGRLVHPAGTAAKQNGGLRIDQASLAVRDAKGRVLVDLTPQAGVDRRAFQRQAQRNGMVVRSVDRHFGTLEGFVPLSKVETLAALRNTGTIAQAVKPHVESGIAESQGVAFQRVDHVLSRGVQGQGITIGALSDSYNTATTDIFGDPLKIHARQDVQSGDLPGRGNPVNSKPVVVLQDGSGLDEGRAMLQIAHDVAPKAKLCFATALGGLVNFTNNVLGLANPNGRCKANVVVDDVTYFDEPMFSDSILTDAIDRLSNRGVHYFSSAGNQGQQNAWQSPVRLLPKSAAASTNLDFSNVDPALYNGGLQDADPGPGTDVAQTLTLGEAGGTLDVQWDDPFDPNGTKFGPTLFKASGEVTNADPDPSFTFTAKPGDVGKQVQFRTDAIPSGTTDLVLTVKDPSGATLASIDTGSSPEVFSTTLKQAGNYTIIVEGFGGDTGDFTVDVRPVLSPSRVTTDFNVLLFAPNGAYLGALADVNPISGRPIELSGLGGLPKIQMVISRSGTGPVGATTIKAVAFDDIYFTEYSDPFTPSIFGHHLAKGGSAVAAYETFKPYLPEYFTSPGGRLPVYFDSDGNRYPSTQVRTQPLIASTDGGNTTFFLADTIRDPDTQPNFFGTSAAAPHAAAIAALVLARHGGPHSVSPPRMRTIMSRATFAHDLDPLRSRGSSHGLSLSAFGAQGSEGSPVPGTLNSRRFFTLQYSGRVPITSLTLVGGTASPTADGQNPPKSDGIVFDRRPFDPSATGAFDTVGFPFTVGSTRGGLAANQVSASYAAPGTGTAVPGQFRRLTLHFDGGLDQGQGLQFGVDRDLALSPFHDSSEGNGADELGGATFIPSGKIVRGGLVFRAELANGTSFTGVMRNKIGHGFSPIDGYGLVNAQRAVFGS